MNQELPIVPRRVDLGFPAPVPRHWAGDPVLTRIADAFSLLFPAGEQFFIHAVHLYRDRIEDEELRARVRGFAYQEAQHSTAHAAYNRMLEDQGLHLGWVDRSLRRRLGVAKRLFPDVLQLALTATAEHLTATMAEGLLGAMHDQFRDADPRMRALYYWHAVEEIEHKAVAFDVLAKVNPSYALRMKGLALATIGLAGFWAAAMIMLLEQDRRAGRRGALAQWKKVPKRPSITQRVFLRGIREYLRRDFHPSQLDNTQLAEDYLARVGLTSAIAEA